MRGRIVQNGQNACIGLIEEALGDVWLSWDMAALLAVCLQAAVLAARRYRAGRWAAFAAFGSEASLVAGLYAVWQLIATFAPSTVAGAVGHGKAIWHLEHALHLPSELTMQKAVLSHPLLVQAANGFYAVVHVPALGVFLLWLFFRHRDHYPYFRNTLAILTFACFVIQLIPVAPPRLIPGLGFVDTGLRYHQSVYGPTGTGISDQLSALPSLHVGWACLVALAVIQVSRSRWRWLVIAHPVLTMVVVVVTANHFWLDGVAAAGLLGLSLLAVSATQAVGTRPPSTDVETAEISA
jgi:PAP2 superfamily